MLLVNAMMESMLPVDAMVESMSLVNTILWINVAGEYNAGINIAD